MRDQYTEELRKRARAQRRLYELEGERDLMSFIKFATPSFEKPKHLARFFEAMDRSMTHPVFVLLEASPRHGKPLAEDTLVDMADGSRKPIVDIRVGDAVVSGRGRRTVVTAVFDQGELPTLTIHTRQGRSVTAEATHRFWVRTPAGLEWVRAGDVVPYGRDASRRPRGDALMVARYSVPEPLALTRDEARFLGYMVGDGNTTQRNCRWTNVDPVVRAEFSRVVAALGGSVVDCDPQTLGVRSDCKPLAPPDRTTRASRRAGVFGGHARHHLKQLLARHGVDGKTAHQKSVPVTVLGASDAVAVEFVAAYFECDGSRGKINPRGANTSFASVSRLLLEGVQTLLARLGIRSSVSVKRGRYRGEVHQSWLLTVLDQARFFDLVPVIGEKSGSIGASRRYEPAGDCPDVVVKVTDGGRRRCFCITVADDESFVANGFITHNTETLMHAYARRLKYRPQDQCAYSSYSSLLAFRKSRQIRNIAASAGVWTGDERTKKDRFDPSAAVNFWQTREGGGLISGGRRGAFVGEGFAFIGIDDPFSGREEAESEVIQETVWAMFKGTMFTRLEPGGSMVVTHQPWNLQDLLARLKRWAHERKMHHVEVITLPAVTDPVYDDDDRLIGGKPLWESRFGIPELATIKESVGEYDWLSQYQCERVPSGKRLFKSFARYHRTDDNGKRVFISCDPGIDENEKREARKSEPDPSGIVVANCWLEKGEVIDREGQRRLVDLLHMDVLWAVQVWLESDDLLDFLEDLQVNHYGGAPVVLEEVGAFKILGNIAARLNPDLDLDPWLPKGSKAIRAVPTAVAARRGYVSVPHQAEWLTGEDGFLMEAQRFTGKPGGKDNRIDALVQLFDYAEEELGAYSASPLSGGESRLGAGSGFGVGLASTPEATSPLLDLARRY